MDIVLGESLRCPPALCEGNKPLRRKSKEKKKRARLSFWETNMSNKTCKKRIFLYIGKSNISVNIK